MSKTSLVVIVLLLGFAMSCGQSKNTTFPPGAVITNSPYNIEMAYIPAGTFIMGANNSADDEDPEHEVSLDDFYIGKNLIKQKEWKAVMGSNPSDLKGDDLPVVNVSWNEVQEFAEKLSEATGFKYRLPTEAEWEYACRAGSTTKFFFGNDTSKIGEYAWYKGNADGKIQPVGKKKPNAWGLHDMSGNVWEWCQDWWDPDFYERSEYKNPFNDQEYLYTSPTTGEEFTARVARSGAYGNTPRGLESAHRHGGKIDQKSYFIGFRIARDK